MDVIDVNADLSKAMFPASTVTTPDVNRLMNNSTPQDPWNRDLSNTDASNMNQMSGSEDGLMGTDLIMMNAVGQTWLWDNATW